MSEILNQNNFIETKKTETNKEVSPYTPSNHITEEKEKDEKLLNNVYEAYNNQDGKEAKEEDPKLKEILDKFINTHNTEGEKYDGSLIKKSPIQGHYEIDTGSGDNRNPETFGNAECIIDENGIIVFGYPRSIVGYNEYLNKLGFSEKKEDDGIRHYYDEKGEEISETMFGIKVGNKFFINGNEKIKVNIELKDYILQTFGINFIQENKDVLIDINLDLSKYGLYFLWQGNGIYSEKANRILYRKEYFEIIDLKILAETGDFEAVGKLDEKIKEINNTGN